MKHQKINNQEELDKLINEHPEGYLEIFIYLGGARSSKQISFTENGDYLIYHEIDDTEEVINHSYLMDSNIGVAMLNGNLYKYNYA